jgi:hypothetical protein
MNYWVLAEYVSLTNNMKYNKPTLVWYSTSSETKYNYVRVRWTEPVTSTGDNTDAYRALIGRLEGKRLLAKPRRTWANNIQIYLTEIWWMYGLHSSLLRIEASGALLWTRQRKLKFHNTCMLGISWVTMQLLNTEEGEGCMEFVSLYNLQHGMHSITNGLHNTFNIPRAGLWGAISGI